MADLAYSEFEKALTLQPHTRLAVQIRRAMVHINDTRGRVAEAMADAEVLCAMTGEGFPERVQVQHECLLARLCERAGDTRRAVKVLRDAVERHGPECARAARAQLNRLVIRSVEHGVVN
jgi:hypothetical protein